MTSLTIVRRIAARPSIVFEALTTPEGIAHWWGPDAGPVLAAETDVRVGGHFRVRFRRLDHSEHESSGEYLEVVKPQRDRKSTRLNSSHRCISYAVFCLKKKKKTKQKNKKIHQ